LVISRKNFLKLAAGVPLLPRALSAQTASKQADVVQTFRSAKAEKAAIKGTTDALTAFITTTTLSGIPTEVVAQAKRCLVDGFGVMLAGSTVKGSQIVRDYVKSAGDRKEATAIGEGTMMTTAAHAALLNAASGHAMDYDDTQLSTTPDRTFGLLTHPTVPVLAASLAVSERLDASGRTFLEAFLTGFEVECKIAEAIKPDHYLHGFHSTGTIGTFGAAASAAKLLKLTPAQTAHALGIAASMSSGIRVNFGSMTKPLHAGHAALSLHIDPDVAVRSPRLAERFARDVNDVVLALPENRALLDEETDDGERDAADGDRLPDRVHPRKELFPDVRADDGHERAVLVGHSMGALVVRHALDLAPQRVRGLVLVDGSLRPYFKTKAESDKFLERFKGDYRAAATRVIDSLTEAMRPADRERVKLAMLATPAPVAISAMEHMNDPAAFLLAPIAVPLTAINAASPYWEGYGDFLRGLNKDADYRVMTGVGHFLMMEKPAEFNALLLEVLRKQGFLKP
jgi:pimeloyl-ACP methyl ester carboxylesterase